MHTSFLNNPRLSRVLHYLNELENTMMGTSNDESSSSRPLLGIGKPLCVVCGVRPAFNNGRHSYPTCGLTCAARLQSLVGEENGLTAGQDISRPMCIVCGLRPQFNNGRRAFPTCGNTCARNLQDKTVAPSSILGQISSRSSTKMCYVCNIRPRCERGGKVYPTCGLTCAAKLHARDRQMALEGPQRIAPNSEDEKVSQAIYRSDNSPRSLYPSESTVLDATNLEPFDCIICFETLERHHLAPFACEHTFCRTCLKNHVISELGEHHYPIICPSCKIGKARSDKPVSAVDDVMIQTLGLGETELAVFYELQLSAHSIAIHCQKCKETMFVDRSDYKHTKIIECPLPRCNYLWCKLCHREVIHMSHGGPKHSCDGSKELEHLMKENGWRHCPGCQTPVQKSEGCNHMTCPAPGCNTHFCYKCGENIIKSLLSADIREATQKHYRGCQLF